MKGIFLSDLHLSWRQPRSRLDSIIEVQFDKLKFIFDFAVINEVENIFIAGDVFNRPRGWYILPAVIDFLKTYPQINIFAIFGQHDTYMYHEETRGNTSLGILEKAGIITILEDFPCELSNGWHAYGCHFGQPIPEPATEKNILIIHASIAVKALWVGHEYISAINFLKKYNKFVVIHCGDIHRQFFIKNEKRMIFNPGPLVRRSAEEYNFKYKPNFIYIDFKTGEITTHIVPHKPSIDVLSRDHIEASLEIKQVMQEFTDTIKDSSGIVQSLNLRDNITKFCETNKVTGQVKKIIFELMEV